MPSAYEFWLTDEAGRRMALLENIAYASYTRSIIGVGTINLAVPFEPFEKEFSPFFQPDWRVECWRSAQEGFSFRREDVFLLRKPLVYRREDGVKLLRFYGRNGLDLLYRRTVVQPKNSTWTSKNNFSDNMMKEIVREQMLYGSAVDENGNIDNTRAFPQNEFFVQGDSSLGPAFPYDFEGKDVIDALKEIKSTTFQKNTEDTSNKRVFFYVEPVDISSYSTPFRSPIGWEFRTRAGLFGSDRTAGVEFSEENENIEDPSYSISHLDEVNTVYVTPGGSGGVPVMIQDESRANSSRWNRREYIMSGGSDTTASKLENLGRAELNKKKPLEEFPVTFLNTIGSRSVPRSLYGLDWDLGDLLPVSFAGKQFNVEISVVYVAIDENGKETITGRNEVYAG